MKREGIDEKTEVKVDPKPVVTVNVFWSLRLSSSKKMLSSQEPVDYET